MIVSLEGGMLRLIMEQLFELESVLELRILLRHKACYSVRSVYKDYRAIKSVTLIDCSFKCMVEADMTEQASSLR